MVPFSPRLRIVLGWAVWLEILFFEAFLTYATSAPASPGKWGETLHWFEHFLHIALGLVLIVWFLYLGFRTFEEVAD